MSGTVKEIIKPIIVLGCICLAITALLAFTNKVTDPIITKAEAEAAQAARTEVLPDADDFEAVEITDMPECVTEIYKAQNGAGYVFMLTVKGYGGDMNLICGVNADGSISACKTLSHSETSGLGSKTAEDPYREQYQGRASDTLSEVDSISGATISSTAYMRAVTDALSAFSMVKEAE